MIVETYPSHICLFHIFTLPWHGVNSDFLFINVQFIFHSCRRVDHFERFLENPHRSRSAVACPFLKLHVKLKRTWFEMWSEISCWNVWIFEGDERGSQPKRRSEKSPINLWNVFKIGFPILPTQVFTYLGEVHKSTVRLYL